MTEAMGTVTIHVAKTHLSRLIERATAGEEIVILRGKTPVARLTSIARDASKRKFGAYKGEFEVPDAFFEPLPEVDLVDDRRRSPVGKGAGGRRRRKQ
jgi:antitoxin (DNA-binding transcriptional repressor) of toxin-antitoxin stability system